MAGEISKAIDWAEAHPVPVAVGVFALGAVAILALNRGGSSSAAGQVAQANATANSAYYAAQSTDAQANDAVAIASIQAQAGTAQTGLNDAASVTNNTTWANTDLEETQSNNAAATSIAPYQTETTLFGDLTQIASLPPTETTSTSSNSGFFGIGASKSVSTQVTPNPNASAASNTLQDLIAEFYTPTSGSGVQATMS